MLACIISWLGMSLAGSAADRDRPPQADALPERSDRKLRVAPGRLPSFSWDRVPRYMHIRKHTAFTADEIRYLASFPLVTLEKTTGAREYGSTEAGTLAAAKAIKQINPATKVLYYRNVFVHYQDYAANASLKDIPAALLVGRGGNQQLVRNRAEAYDLTNAGMRDWWLQNARQVCADPAIDGLFLDGNVKVLEPGYLRNEIGANKKAALLEAYTKMMTETRRVLGPDKLMVANVLRARFPDSGMGRLRVFDGSYIEAFESAPGNIPAKVYLAKGIKAFQDAARMGSLIAFTAGLGEEASDEETQHPQQTDELRKSLTDEQAAKQRFQYLLAIFLICAEKHSYFLAHDGYDARQSSVWMKQAPELNRPLGAPKGPAKRTGDVYTREFAHARVRLDLETRTGNIDWK